MIRYKLTDQDMQTHGGCQWEIGRKKTISKKGNELCSGDVFHFYDSPLLAVLLNPIHADIANPRMFECEIDAIAAHDGLKGGCKKMALVREIELPEISVTQKIAFGVLSAMEVCPDRSFKRWARGWLSGKNRTAEAAADAAVHAVALAADASDSYAAHAAHAALAAYAAADAALAAVHAAYAAEAAARANKHVGFVAIAEKAMEVTA